jgi:HSP20 family protein
MTFIPRGKGLQISLSDLQEEMNRMFDRMWHAGISTAPLDGQEWAPVVDLISEPSRFVVLAEVPGLIVEEIEVSYEQGVLSLKGHKPVGQGESETVDVMRRERRFGKFNRRITIPEPVRADEITAACRRGVLEVILPKKEPAQRQSVKVQVAED